VCMAALQAFRRSTCCICGRVWLQETVFMSTGSPAELFMSDHIEARVPVADITAK
jgi:hypothetical protein